MSCVRTSGESAERDSAGYEVWIGKVPVRYFFEAISDAASNMNRT
jgi:hypothetical protein